MTEDELIFSEDPFDHYDPIFGGIIEDPFPPTEPEPEPPVVIDEPVPPLIIDEPDPKLPSPGGNIGSNNSGWPCACTGLYI